MTDQNKSILYSARIDALSEYNSSFDRGVLRVCYVGRNRNGSYISRETFERCIGSIYNCPIVCRYDREDDLIGAHDMEVAKDRDGTLDLINLTDPVGVVPESANVWFEDIEEEDGTVHEYLCVDVLIWKRQEAYKKLKADVFTDESMEIKIKSGHMSDGIYIIDDFEFTAFCLLGTAEPCYESASLILFSKEEFQEKFSIMMQDLKESFSILQSSNEVVINTQTPEGGNKIMDQKRALMEQFNITEDMIDFNLDDFSIEELNEKFSSMISEADIEIEENHDNEAENTELFALSEQFKSELIDSLSKETIECCFGEMVRYWYVDFDPEISVVYCHDCEDWNLYGFTYSMNGDHVVIDFETKKRKKYAIVDFDEGDQSPAFAAVFAMMQERYDENNATWSQKFADIESAKETADAELEVLRQFKADTESAANDAARAAIFERFSDLAGDETFDALLQDSSAFSIEDLEDKCYAIRGRKQSAAFAYEASVVTKLPIESTLSNEDEPYGGIFIKYNIR